MYLILTLLLLEGLLLYVARGAMSPEYEEEDSGTDTGRQPGSNFNKIRRI